MGNLKWDACNALWEAKDCRQHAAAAALAPAPVARPTARVDSGNAKDDGSEEQREAASKATGRPPRSAERDDS